MDDLGDLIKTFLWTSWMFFVYIGLPVAAWKYFEMGQAIPDSATSVAKYFWYGLLFILIIYDLPGVFRSMAKHLNEWAQFVSEFSRFWQLVIISVVVSPFYFWEDYPNLCLYTLLLVVAPLLNTYDTYRDIMTSKQ